MKCYFFILILNQILFVILPIPNWNISSQSIDLLSSTSSYDYQIYSKYSYEITVTLNKTIVKTDTGITTQNKLTVGSETINVDFEDIDSHYKNKLGCEIVICPKGRFHPFNFGNKTFLKPSSFQEKGNWDLRCYDHFSGYFLIFYLLNDGSNFFYRYSEGDGIYELNNYIYSYFYDYKLENRDYNQAHNYEYKFPLLQYDGGNLKLNGACLTLNFVDKKVDKNVLKSKVLSTAKSNLRASFDSVYKFYFLNYNSVSDFESGYSKSYVNFYSKSDYENSVENMDYITNATSPLTFADNVEIRNINFIYGTKYAYYKIYNLENDKTYYGLINVVDNKVLYNFEEEITSFIPVSSSEMLAITSTSAYKVCIIKSGNSCSDSCSNNNLILDPNGNKSQNGCDSEQIAFMPENICIDANSCDTNYYTLNNERSQCGLCSYFNPSGEKYKLVNTPGRLSTKPDNTESYNDDDEAYAY